MVRRCVGIGVCLRSAGQLIPSYTIAVLTMSTNAVYVAQLVKLNRNTDTVSSFEWQCGYWLDWYVLSCLTQASLSWVRI